MFNESWSIGDSLGQTWRKSVHLKTKQNKKNSAHTLNHYLFRHNITRLCQTSRIYRWQTKVILRYPDNSSAFRSEDLKMQANCRSRTSLSTPFNDRLPFAFRLTQRVAVCIVESFIGQVTPFITLIQLSFIQWSI